MLQYDSNTTSVTGGKITEIIEEYIHNIISFGEMVRASSCIFDKEMKGVAALASRFDSHLYLVADEMSEKVEEVNIGDWEKIIGGDEN